MTQKARWGDKRVPAMDIARGPGKVVGSPWPAAIAMGHLFFFEGGTRNVDLQCIPLYGDQTVDTGDAGPVDFDMIEPEEAECAGRVADLLRSLRKL